MIPKGHFITEIADGDRIRAVFTISDRRLLTTRNGKTYAKLKVADKTGEIPAIIWEDAQQQITGIDPGDAVGVRGIAESYENRLQLRIDKIVKLEEDQLDLSTLIPSSKMDIPSMIKEVEDLVSTIKNIHIRTLVDRFLSPEDLREAFMKAPAAKGIHHNFAGGLLEHTLHVMKGIDTLYPIYTHIGLNRDLLLSGAFLHDIGKIYEYTCTRIIDMTPMGRLVGHIYLSAHMVDQEIESIENFPEELRLQLLHIILGHHGQMEFGSPKPPMTKEAIFLHMLDDFDAKLIGFSSIIEATPDNELFTSYSNVYNRYLYTRTYLDED